MPACVIQNERYNMNNKYLTISKYRASIFTILALPVFYAISRYNYSLFHSLADGVSIVIAACVFVIIWNERHLLDNDYFLYVGITFFFWAFLDFMHLLGNKNMGVFPAYGNLGPAFYIASRYLLSISLIIAPLFISRKLNATLMFTVYALITLLILLSILYWQIFPVCIVEGVGLTPFKVISDYIICFILLAAIGVMIIKRSSFDSRVLWLIVTSIILSIATGLSFTLYTDPSGIMNMVGHLFQIASFYLIYLALIETSLTKPQEILYRKLKQNEDALRESEKKLTDIIAFLPDATLAINKEGRVIIWNKAIEKMTGVPAAEMIGKGDYAYAIPFYGEARPQLMDLVFEDNEEIAAKYPKVTREGDTLMVEVFCHALYNNKGAWVLAKASPLHDQFGNIIGAIESIRDITKRKQAEEALQRENIFIEALFESVPGMLYVYDDQGTHIRHNRKHEEMTGYSAEELSHMNPLSWYDDKTDIVRVEAAINDVFTTGYGEVEAPMRIKNGEKLLMHFTGSRLIMDGKKYFVGVGIDITARKQAEAALRESETQLRAILDATQFPIAIVDVQDNNIDYWSRSALSLFGHTAPTASEWYQIAYPDPNYQREVIDRWKPFLEIASESGQTVNTGEYRVTCSDGSVRICELHATFLLDKLIITFNDITERKRAEADKAALETQNRQLQKSESLGRMAASIAHHFNNQLGAVIGNLEMAMDELPKGTSTHQTLTKAMQSAWTAADMSGLMLTYLGQTHDKRDPLDLSYSCRKILPLIKTILPENVILETDFPTPRPIIMANIGEMQQMLTNMITNAQESIGNNSGTITLSVKTVSSADIPTKNRFPVDWESLDKALACLEVTDTGCGIEDKDIEKLFDPFFSTKFTGRGMGLAVVLGLVNSHKGVITVDSKLGKGSTFRIFFPVSEESLQQSQAAETDRDVATDSASSKKFEEGGTVLVVEDEDMLRNMAAAMLESFGFTVLKTKDGIEALEVFGKHQSEIKFVLTDLTMPRMNGWETLTELRKLQPGIPVILASGYDLAHVMEGDHPELPQAFLAKPYNLRALRNAINQALENRKK